MSGLPASSAQPVILCPALGAQWVSLDPDQQEAVEQGRLLVLSIFGPEATKATPDLAVRRNEFVAALADAVFVPHAVPGGKAEATATRSLGVGRKVLTFDDDQNTRLIELGASPVDVCEIVRGQHEGSSLIPSSVGRASSR